jgi:glycosyltransferase involved in cell wall biosynthesis
LKQNPRNRIVIACNTHREAEIATELGLEARFLNHNAFVNEHIFRPLGDARQVFDAVYSAQMWERKRHELASRIESLCLIFAMHLGEEALRRFKQVREMMPGAFLANGDPTVKGAYRYLTQRDVNECYNKCRVGLCLSAYEGASLASAEYLLAGMPVVSTPSLGGRDVLFTPENTLICDADPEAVREAVDKMLSKRLEPGSVRQATLAKVKLIRENWINAVDDLAESMSPTPVPSFANRLPDLLEDWCGMRIKSVRLLLEALWRLKVLEPAAEHDA